MKRAMLIAGATAAALGLAACETATPYQPAGAHNEHASGGYSEQQIEANRWRVEFAGNSLTSRQTVERYLLFRSAQLTVAQGYDWFQAVDRHTSKQSEFVGEPDPLAGPGWGPYWGFYRPGFGWGYGYWGDPFWGGPIDIEQVSRYEASVEILMGRGAKPADNPRAYDAREVVAHLQATIQYPKPN